MALSTAFVLQVFVVRSGSQPGAFVLQVFVVGSGSQPSHAAFVDLDAFDVVDPYSGESLCKLRDMLPGSALPSSSWMSKPSTPIALPTPGASRRSRPRAPPPSRT